MVFIASIFSPFFRIKNVSLDSRIKGIEHYGVIMNIAALFKVSNTDTCLISYRALYSNSVFSVVDMIEILSLKHI